MVEESRSLKTVGGSASVVHSVGHARWATREDTNLGQEDVLLLEVVKEGVEVGTTKVGDGAKTGEQTPSREPLEVTLTDVLKEREREKWQWLTD